jgi:hypothetical protein
MHNRKQDVSIEKKSSEKDLFEHMRETSLKLPSQQKKRLRLYPRPLPTSSLYESGRSSPSHKNK